MELVEVKKDGIYCDTGLIARKFGMKHKDVCRTMETLIPKLDDFRVADCTPKNSGFDPQYLKEDRHYRGTDYTAYLLNRDCFMILAMRFDTPLARRWQGMIISAFNTMEQRILSADANAADPAWLVQRGQGKVARLEETDAIKEFVEYATAQGSTKAQFYYKHLTNSTYKALGLMKQSRPMLRETMDMYELSELLLAERLAKNALKKYMELGRNYKDIYDSVKNDLLSFGTGLKLA